MTITQYLFSLNGRIGRGRWWFGQLLNLLAVLVLNSFLILLTPDRFTAKPGQVAHPMGIVPMLILLAAFLACVYSNLAIDVKRCHDRGWSGWFLLVGLIPLISIWVFVELAILPGEEGPNKFGEDPQRKIATAALTPA
jgi:uncharacterized membrane protein YhaH (DUF805 family)